MDTYKFYYDESEHSRKINYNTVTAPNYYDNFVTVVVGWAKEKEKEVFKKYEDFENKDYPVNDIENVLEFFKAKHKDIVFDVLANSEFWGEDLTKYDNIYDTVNHWYTNIKEYGIRSAMEMLLNE